MFRIGTMPVSMVSSKITFPAAILRLALGLPLQSRLEWNYLGSVPLGGGVSFPTLPKRHQHLPLRPQLKLGPFILPSQ